MGRPQLLHTDAELQTVAFVISVVASHGTAVGRVFRTLSTSLAPKRTINKQMSSHLTAVFKQLDHRTRATVSAGDQEWTVFVSAGAAHVNPKRTIRGLLGSRGDEPQGVHSPARPQF
ncbi:hypothetical protein JOB18_024934 [Solea senegalensis]|uniref:Uncharacterized protein n=1 Tax=Solea senegalensis TaxID=28829 RepID=A0AAV6RTV1_SOLSE|nr:hypothetical protein JOB18_024934 [Solea senegalensis]